MTALRQKGFTLVELLIGMVLLGLIFTLLFGGLRLGSRSWDGGAERAEASAQLRAVQGFLRRKLGQALPLTWQTGAGTRLAFEGTPETLKFAAPLSAHAGGGGLYLLGLALEQGETGQRLILKRAPADHEAADFSALEQGEQSVLAEQVKSMAVAYFGAASAGEAPEWQDRWEDTQRLPLLVRIRVELDGGRIWPDFVAPIVVDKACTWDAFHRRCTN